MDLASLSAAYTELLDTATARVFAASTDGGWNAGQVLAHIVIGDRVFASAYAEVLLGRQPAFNNLASQSVPYLDAVVRAAGSWQTLLDTLRHGGEELLELLAQLNGEQARQTLPFSGVQGDREFAFDISADEFVGVLATQHLPSHRQQLLALAKAPA